MNEEKNIPWTLLFGIAGFLDALSYLVALVTLIPIVGWVLGPIAGASISILAGLSFWFYFLWKGHNLWKGALGTTFVESIPLLNMLPTWTAYVAGAYLKIKGVEKLGVVSKFLTKAI